MEGNNAIIKQAVRHGGVFLLALFVFAATAQPLKSSDGLTHLGFLNNRVYSDTTISAADSPYQLEDSFTVQPGATLTIEPGVVIKVSALITITVNGSLVMGSLGSSEPVVITSIKDDAYAGDSNHDGSASSPAAGDWLRIAVNGADASLVMENAVLRYGGLSSNMFSANNGASATIASSTFEYSNSYAIAIAAENTELSVTSSVIRHNLEGIGISTRANASITGSHVTDNSRRGIAIDTNADVANLTITGNVFSGNATAGIDFDDADDTLVAANNWWGHASGPTNAGNPGGTGDAVVGAVTFSPWTNQDPANQAPVLSFAGSSGYTADGVEPDVSFVTQDVPMFKVLFSDPEGSVPAYVRLVVASSTFAMATSTAGVYEYAPASGAFSKGTYSYHFEASDGISTARLPASGELSFGVKLVPVILVPGITGSELEEDGDSIWLNLFDLVTSASDDFMDALLLDEDGTSVNDVVVTDVIREKEVLGLGSFDYFNGLIGSFESAGYAEDTDLFVFPYDWRLDNRSTSLSLKEKIDEVLDQTNSEKVNIVVHSMGGLVAKQYVLDNGSSDINKLIFIGTPHLGSPKSVKTLLFGDDLGFKLTKTVLGITIAYNPTNINEIKKIAKNMLSIYQLVPSQLYISQIGSYFLDIDFGAYFDYGEIKTYMSEGGLNDSHIQDAESFHSNALDNFDLSGIDAYNIVGCDTATLGKVIVRTDEFIETDAEYGVGFVAGDGTVPFRSASAIDTPADKTFYATGVEHATMPSQSSIKQLIMQIITDDIDISSLGNIMQDTSECVFNGQVVSVHSPVDLHIYDADGNHVGPDENGDIELNIEGATYEQIGDNKFIFIPNTDSVSYDIQLDGTGDGTFSLRVSKVENNEVTETAYYSDIPVNESSQAQITLSTNVSGTILQVDESGSGSFEMVSVAAVLDSEQSSDTTKPSTVISVSGGASSAAFTLSASDDNSGILKTEYSLDNGSTWHTYENQVILTTQGQNTVLFRSKDRAGNLEDYETQTIKVYSPAVVIMPLSAPSNQDRHPELVSGSDSEPAPTHPEPEILGEQKERPKNEQYTEDAILTALRDANIGTLLDYLGLERNLSLEQEIAQKYSQRLGLSHAGINFIAYGTKSTQKLGTGERAGVLYSFKEAFGKLSSTTADWDDVVKIATNQLPSQRNINAEQRARDAGATDDESVMMIAYGLRPTNRNLDLEREGIVSFVETYGRLPSSTFDWNILRSIVY